MRDRLFEVDGAVLTLEDLAKRVDEELKLTPIGILVEVFRRNDMTSKLREIAPHLSSGNRDNINNVLDGVVCGKYF